ncbi:PREDICTED: AN1-type zinc finger protein 2A isoform X2 [Dipodomys ordii]|uniref:AN1-type zinc finger protein 2A isoform X2 n=1 Tax=Dipodomys ordii TaxID=10020 RepID=A0A1S3FQR7_DIPOR|nr:PREDICTED: AN1-type zinc finger protein 2A isoform X2 [Dipodomys ordii]
MEFPDLGKHCSEKTCKQLDFLPLKCDACKQDFCKDHFTCATHTCPFAFKKVFAHRCSRAGCRRKEMLQLLCVQCQRNFCIQHRHPLDHSCSSSGSSASRAGCSATTAESKAPGTVNTPLSSWLTQLLRYLYLHRTWCCSEPSSIVSLCRCQDSMAQHASMGKGGVGLQILHHPCQAGVLALLLEPPAWAHGPEVWPSTLLPFRWKVKR